MSRGVPPVAALAILAEILVFHFAAGSWLPVRFALHALVLGVGAYFLRRSPARARALPLLLIGLAASLSLLDLRDALTSSRQSLAEPLLREQIERDGGEAQSRFESLLEREREVLTGMPAAVLNPRTGREELFALLAAYRETLGRRGEEIALSLYDEEGRALAWVGEASVLPGDELRSASAEPFTQIVRRGMLGTRLFSVRAKDGASAPRYAVSELLLDAPHAPEAWRRLVRFPSGLRSQVRAEFLEGRQMDAPLGEFLEAGGDRYWLKGTASGLELMVALRGETGKLLGLMTVSPESGAAAAARRARAAALPRIALFLAAAIAAAALAFRSVVRGRVGLADSVALAGSLAALRGVGLVASPFLRGVPGFDYRLFSFRAPFGLAENPAAALMTALALLALAGLLAASLDGRSVWRRVATGTAGIAMGLAVVALTPEWVSDSTLNLARSPLMSPSAPRLALYTSHAALALAAGLLIFSALAPRSRRGSLRALGGVWLGSVCFSYILLARETSKVPPVLIESALAPEVRDAPAQMRERVSDLLSAASRKERWEVLASSGEEALARMAFETWRESELGRDGLRSALALTGPEGAPLGSFAYGLPASVFNDTKRAHGAGAQAAGDTREDGEPSLPPLLIEDSFSVLSLDVPLLRGEVELRHEGDAVGRLAVLVSTEHDNLPFLTLSDPLLRSLGGGREERVFDEYFGGAPLFLAYAPSGEVLFPSPERVAPLAARDLAVRGPVWVRTRFEGDEYRTLLFPTPGGPRGVGYAASSRIATLAGLIRAVLACLPLLGLVLLAAALGSGRAAPTLLSFKAATSFLAGSYYRKLLAVVLIASLAPLLVLAILFRDSVERRTREGFEREGIRAAGTIRRLLEDYVESGAGTPGGITPIESRTLFWIGRTVHQDIHLFAGDRLVATSRGDTAASGLRTLRLSADVAHALAVDRPPQFLSKQPRTGRQETLVYAPIRQRAGAPEGVLAVPLILQERDMTRAAEEVADAILVATCGLGLLLLGIGYLFARRLSVPIRDLGRAAERIALGDLGVRVRARGSDEVRQLVDTFNGMSLALADQRDDLRRRKDYIEAILLNVTTGVISTTAEGVVRTANPAASILLGLPADLAAKNLVAELAALPDLQPLRDLWSESLAGPLAGSPREVSIHRDGEEMRLRSVVLPLIESEADEPGRIFLVEDITDVMRSNRLAAWAEMARRIAHEIKNPLTPIQLSAEHLLRARGSAEGEYERILRECVEAILEQVRTLREISSDFSAYARLPELKRERTDLGELVGSTLSSYRAGAPPGLRIELSLQPVEPVEIDARVLRRAFVNLIENSLQAMDGTGVLSVSLRRIAEGDDGPAAEIVFADTGEGMDETTRARIFEPYFSTRDSGVGLGLAIARRAVEEHGGEILVESEPGRGTRVIVRLPLEARPRVRP